MVPTHFGNLDSILIGWVISALGLPAFIYGAGLNLFNIRIVAYFINSLGAYKVNRRKKNLLYLETLKHIQERQFNLDVTLSSSLVAQDQDQVK